MNYIQWGLPLLSGTIVWILQERRKEIARKQERENTLIEREREYSLMIEERIEQLLKRNEQLHTELIAERLEKTTTHRLDPEDILKSVIDSDNGLSWCKQRLGPNTFKMLRVSKGYARMYLAGPPELYDGLEDHQIYPKDVSEKFNEHDEKCYQIQEGINVSEEIKNTLSGVEGWFIGRKYSIRLMNGNDYIFATGYHSEIKVKVENP